MRSSFSWFETNIWKRRYYFPSLIKFKTYLMAKINLIQLEQYVDLIDTSLYKDFKINENVSRIPIFIHWVIKWEIHVMKYTEKSGKFRTLFIPLCIESHDRYYFNILRMTTIFIIFTLRMKYMPWHILRIEKLFMTIY